MRQAALSGSMRIVSLLVALAILALSSGCASMFKGTKETIYIRSNLPNTTFFANERELGTGSSAITTIPKKKLSKTILRAEKQGCHPKTAPIETSFDAVTLLGVFLDYGIVSIICVDWLGTGAITQAAQTEYILTPEPITQD
jgi:hypothetical protein